MLKIDYLQLHQSTLEVALRGMRNPMNSWKLSDSYWDCDDYATTFWVGSNDLKLAKKLAKGGSTHAKYRRMIVVSLDITAPLYWWKEFDTYKVGTVANSCSTMHKIHSRALTMDDFSTDHLTDNSKEILQNTIDRINLARTYYLSGDRDKEAWWQMIQMLPSSYNQTRTVMLNYEIIAKIRAERKDHKLDEWNQLIEAFETLPHVKDLC